MVGTRGAGVDACRLHPARQCSRNKAEVDPLAVVGGHAFILSVPDSDPGVDESGEPIEPSVALALRTDDSIVLRRAPREVEVAHQDRFRRHRRHLALGPTGVGLRMTPAPGAALARSARMNLEQRLDLRQPRGGAQMAQVYRIEPDGAGTFGDDDRLERALLNAVLRERAVF